MKDDLGTRMKENYEQRAQTALPRRTYTILRVDGKAFHTFTKHSVKPFDPMVTDAMNFAAMQMMAKIQGAKLAYVQSDEISVLLADFETITTDAWFGGNVQKMASVAAATATAEFNYFWAKKNPEPIRVVFDGRVFSIPDPTEVENYFIWRQKDAIRNSVSMLARSIFSHKQCDKKSTNDLKLMVAKAGQPWEEVDEGLRNGRIVYRKEEMEAGITRNRVTLGSAPDFMERRARLKYFIPRLPV